MRKTAVPQKEVRKRPAELENKVMMGNIKVSSILSGGKEHDKFSDALQVKRIANGNVEWNVVNLIPDLKYQTLTGFGGAFTEATALTWGKLSAGQRDEVLRAYFHEEGLGYSFCRTHMGSCDFGTEAYDNFGGREAAKEGFQIRREREILIPMIKEAMKYADIKLLVSPWSPCAWMKDNNSRMNGGKLKEEYYEAWAAVYALFCDALAEEGIRVYGVTVQNEAAARQTWESCVYTAEEERDFVKKYLGKLMRERGIRLYFWDHNKEKLYERAKVMYEDKEAADYVAGIACHWYSGDHFEQLRIVKELWPSKEILFSEGCVSSPERGIKKENVWQFAKRYAHDIIGDLNNGLTAFIDWNLLLDENNGPFHNRFSDRYCDAPMVADTVRDQVYFQPSYYYIGHFSRYIRPGAVRIGCSTFSSEVEATAFEVGPHQYVAVVLNSGQEDRLIHLRIAGEAFEYLHPADSIVTHCMETSECY